jgi:transposase
MSKDRIGGFCFKISFFMLKYSIGIDVSSEDLHVCICVIDALQKVTVKSSCSVTNNTTGFRKLSTWIAKHHKEKKVPLVIVMEATGVYYENCALYLNQSGYDVSVLLPNKAKKWMESEGLKSKNDKIDAQGLAKMGAEKSLEIWQPAAEYYYQLRLLTRHYQGLQEQKTVFSNQLHALEQGMYQNKTVIKDVNQLLTLLDKQIERISEAIEEQISTDEEVKEKVDRICEIKGLGFLTIAVVLAETNGFALFKNAPQLISYAGYDVVENQSGSHVGKTRISKKGNCRIRRALHMPALSVVRHKEKIFLNLYERTYEKHHIKMKSYVAVQKKLLQIIFGLWKNGTRYDQNYKNKEHTQEQEQMSPLGTAHREDKAAIAA